MSAVLDDVVTAAQMVPLSEAVEVNPKIDRSAVHDDLDVSFVPMAAVEALSGGIDVSTVRKYADVKKGYTNFRDGDILFAKVTPCMENGKMAIAHQLVNGIGFGSTEFHVLRPRDGVDARYVYYFVSSQTFRKEASGHMTGAVGLRRVPGAYIEEQLIPLPGIERQRAIVAALDTQFSRLDEAVDNLQRVKANLSRYARASIVSLTNPDRFDETLSGTIADVAISLDNMRKPVNKAERATRPGKVPYLGANGQTGWIDKHLFDEEIVLVVEDETFVGLTPPFSYYFAGKCWVNNHTHVLRAKSDCVLPKYLNLALSYYPFIPLTTGSTGRRKLTKGTLMAAPIQVPTLARQREVVAEVDRCLSLVRRASEEVDTNLKRALSLRHATLHRAFNTNWFGSAQ